MFCPKCGMENPTDAQLCKSCSWVLTSVSITARNAEAELSGLAVTSLVLAVLGFFTCGITLIPALICGIISLVKIEKSKGRLRGKGYAIAGIAAPAALVPLALLMGILMPALARVRQVAYRMTCGANMSVVGRAMLVYADDFDGRYPSGSNWCDLLIENVDVNSAVFLCPAVHEGPCNFALNEQAVKLGADAPTDMVLLYDAGPGWNRAGGRELLSVDNHHGEGCNVMFNDGHVRFITSRDVNDLKWHAE